MTSTSDTTAQAATDAGRGEEPAPTRWQRFPSTRAMWLWLAVITVVAGFLRFFRLGYQCYWCDESYTINRVHGSFGQMLASLSNQGFPPGWYALLRWWTMLVEWAVSPGHWWTRIFGAAANPGYTALTPEVTRALPALLGTLTVPAMYFLARQFTDRKGALLAAILTAVNPYLIYYARDIKMYHATWFFVILNTAIFFRWQTTHRHLAWVPLFVLTGFAMTAMHFTAWFIVALQLIFLLSRPRLKSLDGPLWLFSVGLMTLLPIYWYENGTNWWDRVTERHGDTNLTWILNYTDMSWRTIASLPCSHYLGYLWPSWPPDANVRRWFSLGSDFDAHAATRSLPWLAEAQLWVAIAFAAILVLGLVPWRGIRRNPERPASVTHYRSWWLALWLVIPTVCLAATWIPKDSPWYKTVWHNFNRVSPLWEPRYLGIIIPAWLLWMAASLRRLPTWPVRAVAMTFVLGVSLISAGSNYFIDRNPPFDKVAEAAVGPGSPYNPQNKKQVAIAHVNLTAPSLGMVIPVSYALARHVRPMTPGDWFVPNENFDASVYGADQLYAFLRRVRTNPDVQAIVVSDRYGDLVEDNEPLSNKAIGERLGPRWKLVSEKSHRHYYEWRFYIFHTWRTRVYQRQASEPLTMPGASGRGDTAARGRGGATTASRPAAQP